LKGFSYEFQHPIYEQAEVSRLKDGLAARRATDPTHELGIVLGAIL